MPLYLYSNSISFGYIRNRCVTPVENMCHIRTHNVPSCVRELKIKNGEVANAIRSGQIICLSAMILWAMNAMMSMRTKVYIGINGRILFAILWLSLEKRSKLHWKLPGFKARKYIKELNNQCIESVHDR